MSTPNGIRERLLDHPERIDIELMGEERPFLLTMYGIEKAQQKGIEIVPAILSLGNRLASLFGEENEDIELGSEEMEQKIKDLVRDEDARTLSIIIWWGLSTFDDDLTLEEVQLMLTPGTLMSLVPDVMDKINAFAEDSLPEDAEMAGESEDGAEGN